MLKLLNLLTLYLLRPITCYTVIIVQYTSVTEWMHCVVAMVNDVVNWLLLWQMKALRAAHWLLCVTSLTCVTSSSPPTLTLPYLQALQGLRWLAVIIIQKSEIVEKCNRTAIIIIVLSSPFRPCTFCTEAIANRTVGLYTTYQTQFSRMKT